MKVIETYIILQDEEWNYLRSMGLSEQDIKDLSRKWISAGIEKAMAELEEFYIHCSWCGKEMRPSRDSHCSLQCYDDAYKYATDEESEGEIA
jgi:hypothetical protein